jgi:protein subunit release factor A
MGGETMINNNPRWVIKVVHVPTGIEVIRTSNHFRSMWEARNAAIKYLKSQLAFRYGNFNLEDVKVENYAPDPSDREESK